MADLFHEKGTNNPIEANIITSDNAQAVAVWCGGVAIQEHDALDLSIEFGAVNVPTATGIKRAYEDYYVVRLPTGDFDVLTPNQFDAKFEAVARKPMDVRSRRII